MGGVDSLEIIKSYPEDKYLPSYLLLARFGQEEFHVLFGLDKEGDNVRVVTAYHPSPAVWSSDLKRRKEK